jgi:MFS family permease
VLKIIEHPISVREAFWSPYKRMGRMIGEQIEKFAAAKDKAVEVGADAGIAKLGTPAAGAPAPFDVGKFAGIFAAIGLALGALGTALAAVLGGFFAMPVWQMPLAVGGILFLISGPSMVIAFMKLRQRNLGPILDAGGWAVNSKAKINIPFGTTLTKIAALPPGAERSLRDPFAEEKTPWKRWVLFLILFTALGMAWDKGYIQALSAKVISTMSDLQAEKSANAVEAAPAVEKTSAEPSAEAPANNTR